VNIPYILTIITFFPLIAGGIPILFMSKEDETLIKRWAIIASLVPLALSIYLWATYNPAAGLVVTEEQLWIPGLDVFYRLGVDGINLPLIFLTTLLSTLSLYYSSHVIEERVKEYFLFFLMLETGLMGVFVSLDFFLFYVFWEIELVPMYFIIGVWGHERREYAAIKFFIYTLAGSVLMLLAMLGIYFSTGTFSLVALPGKELFGGNFALQSLAFWGIFIAMAIKVPIWPFHTWLPDAHVEAPAAGSVMLAGVLLKLGTFGFIRILLPIFPKVFHYYAIPIAILAVISIVYGALVSMAQSNLKRMIAYSSVNHMGYVMLGIAAAAYATGTTGSVLVDRATALNGAVLQMFNHGIITGGLFFLAGMLYHRTHSYDLGIYGGLGVVVPVYYGVVAFMSMASLGLPGLAGFVSEFLVFRGAFAIIPYIAAFGVIGIVVTAAFFLWKVIQTIFLGPLNQRWRDMPDLHRYELISLAPLMAITLAIGVYPAPILNLINSGAVAILRIMG